MFVQEENGVMLPRMKCSGVGHCAVQDLATLVLETNLELGLKERG